jgi:hypothetical protein
VGQNRGGFVTYTVARPVLDTSRIERPTQHQDAKDFTAVRRGDIRTSFWRLGGAPAAPACRADGLRGLVEA